MLYCCEECQNYEQCSESGGLLEGCCKECFYYEECHGEESDNEEDDE